MQLLNIFKKDKKVFTPLYETDFKKWAETCTEDELTKYVEKICEDGKEFDYTKSMWGHAFTHSRKVGQYIHYGSGFYGQIIGCKRPAVGSFLLMKTDTGKIGRYMILNIKWEIDPDDMFWAYIVGLGYKE